MSVELNKDLLAHFRTKALERMNDQLHQLAVDIQIEDASMQVIGKSFDEITRALAPKAEQMEVLQVKMKVMRMIIDKTEGTKTKGGSNHEQRGVLVYHPSARKQSERDSLSHVRQG